MRIKDDLPQFKGEHALLIVTGDQSGVLYHVSRGQIDKIAELKEEIPTYSDREGSFMSRVKLGLGSFRTLSGSGAPYEKKEQKAQTDFLNKFQKAVKHAVHKYGVSSMYIFAPDYFEPQIIGSLENAHKQMVAATFSGTFIKEHPFTILKKINELHQEIKEKVQDNPPSEEAQKILNKGQDDPQLANPRKREEQVKQFMQRGKK